MSLKHRKLFGPVNNGWASQILKWFVTKTVIPSDIWLVDCSLRKLLSHFCNMILLQQTRRIQAKLVRYCNWQYLWFVLRFVSIIQLIYGLIRYSEQTRLSRGFVNVNWISLTSCWTLLAIQATSLFLSNKQACRLKS